MATILLVEDNNHIMKINEKILAMQGYHLLCAENIAHARTLLSFHKVDLMVLDILLPDGDGLSFCNECKKKYNFPVLLLSALGENSDVVKGLRAGGDDYLTKPYDLEVFLAHVEARLRASMLQETELRVGALVLDTVAMTAMFKGRVFALTQKEFSVLSILAKNHNCVVSAKQLTQSVWGGPVDVDHAVLWTVISRLKKKLEEEHTGISISTKRFEGYILEYKESAEL